MTNDNIIYMQRTLHGFVISYFCVCLKILLEKLYFSSKFILRKFWQVSFSGITPLPVNNQYYQYAQFILTNQFRVSHVPDTQGLMPV